MPAWINHSLKIVTFILSFTIVAFAFIGAVVYTIWTGWTIVKAVIIMGLLFLWPVLYVVILKKLYYYLFCQQKDEDQ